MPSKKKSKPSYSVPEDLQTAPQAGWVYRSDVPRSSKAKAPRLRKPPADSRTSAAQTSTPAGKSIPQIAAPPPPATPSSVTPAAARGNVKETKDEHSRAARSKSSDGIMDLAARAISSGFEAMGNVVLLTTRIITAPISMGMKMLGLK